MKLWGKELTREDAIARISELQAEIYRIEHSAEYARRSDAGDDSMWYCIESKLDEIEELENEYGLNEEELL